MKCPLYLHSSFTEDRGLTVVQHDCLKEECAWWVEAQDNCAIKDIALSLSDISTDLTQILKRMPHEGQFREGQFGK